MFKGYATKPEDLQTTQISFFRLVDKIWGNSESPSDPLRRFCALMRAMQAQSFLLETLVPNDELRYELDSARRRCGGGRVELHPRRLTFFASLPESRRWKPVDMPPEHLLGYAVIVNLTLPDKSMRSYVLEAVVREPALIRCDNGSFAVAPLRNYYVHCIRPMTTTIGPEADPRDLPITGTFFSQQNNLTSTCAHAAARAAINSAPFVNNEKLTNQQINEILGVNLHGADSEIGYYKPLDRKSVSKGLTTDQLANVVDALGANTVLADFKLHTHVEYDEYVYPQMESGFPVILGLEGYDTAAHHPIEHTVTVIGHTLNGDRWWPEARSGYGMLPHLKYIPAVEWTDHFVISDEGYGMYLTMQCDVVRNLLVPTKNTALHVVFAMGLAPKGIGLAALAAETLARAAVQWLLEPQWQPNSSYWLTRLRSQKFVCRTLFQSRENLSQHLSAQMPEKSRRTYERRLARLPERFWLTEITVPHLYTVNEWKIGDVVVSADPDGTREDRVEMIWLPGTARFGKEKILTDWPLVEPIPLTRRPTA
jgi:hypothetical protein